LINIIHISGSLQIVRDKISSEATFDKNEKHAVPWNICTSRMTNPALLQTDAAAAVVMMTTQWLHGSAVYPLEHVQKQQPHMAMPPFVSGAFSTASPFQRPAF
jgi:hypothetical protein